MTVLFFVFAELADYEIKKKNRSGAKARIGDKCNPSGAIRNTEHTKKKIQINVKVNFMPILSTGT